MENLSFQPISCRISETVRDCAKIAVIQ